MPKTRPGGRLPKPEKEKKPKNQKIRRMSQEELAKFVDDYCSNRVYTDLHVPGQSPELVKSVFMILALMEFPFSKAECKNIGRFWEYLSEAGPMAVNGQPIFFSVRIMHKDDWTKLVPAIQAEIERRKNIKV
jgi:hypothetical protein